MESAPKAPLRELEGFAGLSGFLVHIERESLKKEGIHMGSHKKTERKRELDRRRRRRAEKKKEIERAKRAGK